MSFYIHIIYHKMNINTALSRYNKKKEALLYSQRLKGSRQRPTFPPGLPSSIIGARGLNYRVRDGIGCGPSAIATGKKLHWEKIKLENRNLTHKKFWSRLTVY